MCGADRGLDVRVVGGSKSFSDQASAPLIIILTSSTVMCDSLARSMTLICLSEGVSDLRSMLTEFVQAARAGRQRSNSVLRDYLAAWVRRL